MILRLGKWDAPWAYFRQLSEVKLRLVGLESQLYCHHTAANSFSRTLWFRISPMVWISVPVWVFDVPIVHVLPIVLLVVVRSNPPKCRLFCFISCLKNCQWWGEHPVTKLAWCSRRQGMRFCIGVLTGVHLICERIRHPQNLLVSSNLGAAKKDVTLHRLPKTVHKSSKHGRQVHCSKPETSETRTDTRRKASKSLWD